MSDLDIINSTLQGNLASLTGVTALVAQLRQTLRRRTFVVQDTDAATAATAVGEYEVFRAPVPCQLIQAHLAAGIAVVASDTNYKTVAINKRTAAAPTVKLVAASINTAVSVAPFSGSLVADVPFPLTLSATAANLQMVAGDVLTHEVIVVGTGVALTAAATAKGGKYNLTYVIEEL